MEQLIQQKLQAGLGLRHLQVLNESHMHAGPATDSHFKLVVVADEFDNLNQVKRHQLVYRLLAEELQGAVHALALHTYSGAEWEQVSHQFPASPACAGGTKT